MVQSNIALHTLFIGGMIFLSLCFCLCLFRAIIGPRFTDRMVAINMIGTITVIFICMLSVFLDESYLVDVALVYTLISFLAVVILCRIVSNHHRGRNLYLKRKKEQEETGQND